MMPTAAPGLTESVFGSFDLRKLFISSVAVAGMSIGAAFAQGADDRIDNVAQPAAGSFTATYSAGIEYDSNVSVLDVDVSTTRADFAALFDFGVAYEHTLGEGTKVEAGYDFGQDIQFEVTGFNTQTHRGKAEISHDFGGVTAGATYQLIYSRLDGAGFLRFHRLTPFVSGYAANRKVYWRGSYIYTDKNFINRIDRDGDVHAGSLDVYYFLNGLKTYLISGYRFETENTAAPQFDFDSHNVRVRLVQRVALTERPSKLRVGFRYENRNYKAITPSIGEIRDDVRYRAEASFETPITDVIYTELSARYDILDSNLPSVDFEQGIVALRIGGRF
ncbi:MAG: hypothetical protein AAGA09_00935 [Pseudomonadota bacterium]